MLKQHLYLVLLIFMLAAGASIAFANQSAPRSSGTAEQRNRTRTPQPTATPVDTSELTSFDASYQDVIAELQLLEVIPVGGSIVYQAQYTFFDGRGAFYTPLAVYQPHTNVVIGGELKFRPGDGDELQLCILGSRITEVGAQAAEFLFVGMDNAGDVFFIDRSSASAVPETAFELTSLDLETSHEFLMIVYEDELLVYVDGDLVLESDALTVRKGTYGIALASGGFGGRCEASDFWIYELDVIWDGAQGVCGVTVNRPVNLRSGPGVTFDLAGQIEASEVLSVAAQTQTPDGYIWWQLVDDRWVRSDLVRELGNCEALAPVIEAEQ